MLELYSVLAHGAFNGAMRLAQGGKFEHGFLSGGVYAEREVLQVILKRYTLAVEINPVEAYLHWDLFAY